MASTTPAAPWTPARANSRERGCGAGAAQRGAAQHRAGVPQHVRGAQDAPAQGAVPRALDAAQQRLPQLQHQRGRAQARARRHLRAAREVRQRQLSATTPGERPQHPTHLEMSPDNSLRRAAEGEGAMRLTGRARRTCSPSQKIRGGSRTTAPSLRSWIPARPGEQREEAQRRRCGGSSGAPPRRRLGAYTCRPLPRISALQAPSSPRK